MIQYRSDDIFDDGRFGPPLRLSPTVTPPEPFAELGSEFGSDFGRSAQPPRKFSKGKDDLVKFDKLDPFEGNSADSLRVPLFEDGEIADEFEEPSPVFSLIKIEGINQTEPILNLEDNNWSNMNWMKGKRIGVGGFATVFEGLNNDTGEIFAAKQLDLDLSSSRNSKKVADSIAELQLMRKLHHPNIVQYLGAQLEDGRMFVFLELMSSSISHMLGEFGPFSEKVIKRYTKQIIFGLEYLHKNDIIHRDIKGANVLVDASGVVKLADFGCAKIFQGLQAYSSNCKSVLGTPYFMAPEVIRGQPYGKSADIWSLGCTLVEMATGRPPWSTRFPEPAAAMFHIGSAKEVSEIPNNMSDLYCEFLQKMLRIDRKGRSRASELLEHPFLL